MNLLLDDFGQLLNFSSVRYLFSRTKLFQSELTVREKENSKSYERTILNFHSLFSKFLIVWLRTVESLRHDNSETLN